MEHVPGKNDATGSMDVWQFILRPPGSVWKVIDQGKVVLQFILLPVSNPHC